MNQEIKNKLQTHPQKLINKFETKVMKNLKKSGRKKGPPSKKIGIWKKQKKYIEENYLGETFKEKFKNFINSF